MQIGDFSKASGLPKDTLRFYERKGLLQPQLLANGYRSYDAAQLERAKAIRIAKLLGFTLAEIAEAIVALESNPLSTTKKLQFLDAKIAALATRIASLQATRRYLLAKAKWVRAGERGTAPSYPSRA